jgi:hypothetical protein
VTVLDEGGKSWIGRPDDANQVIATIDRAHRALDQQVVRLPALGAEVAESATRGAPIERRAAAAGRVQPRSASSTPMARPALQPTS